jgi:hypothetical protein
VWLADCVDVVFGLAPASGLDQSNQKQAVYLGCHVLLMPASTCCVQVWVGVVPTGPTGANLNSSFANRGSDK